MCPLCLCYCAVCYFRDSFVVLGPRVVSFWRILGVGWILKGSGCVCGSLAFWCHSGLVVFAAFLYLGLFDVSVCGLPVVRISVFSEPCFVLFLRSVLVCFD